MLRGVLHGGGGPPCDSPYSLIFLVLDKVGFIPIGGYHDCKSEYGSGRVCFGAPDRRAVRECSHRKFSGGTTAGLDRLEHYRTNVD